MNSIFKDYSIKGIIGEGTFSIVKLGINRKTGEKVAIKVLDKKKILSKRDLQRVGREIKILQEISHINLIKIYKIKEDSQNYYIIMEYCENGELFNHIVKKKKLEEKESSYYYFQLINGLDYIHSKKIIHRDLKPENLLIGKKNILKIIDFGLSTFNKNEELLSTPCGSPCYASPEVISGKKYDGNLIDIWSSGIILFAMLCGHLPFEGLTNKIIFKKIIKCKIDYPKHLSNISLDLLKKILVNNPEKRITLSEIKKHPFYLKGKEIFKKINPSLFDEMKNMFILKNNNIQFIENRNNDYLKFINKTEGNEKEEFNNRFHKHSINSDILINKRNITQNDKLIYNMYNTPEKNRNIFKSERINPSNDDNLEYNNKGIIKLPIERDLNSIGKYTYRRNIRNLTDLHDCNLDINKKSGNLNIEKRTLKKDLPKLIMNISHKNSENSSSKKFYSYRKIINNPNKLLLNFKKNLISTEINDSNFLMNYYKKRNKKNHFNEFHNNKIRKNLFEEINTNSKFIYSFEKEIKKKYFLNDLSPEKYKIIKKYKSIKDESKGKNNNSNKISKIKGKNSYFEKNLLVKEKRYKFNILKRKKIIDIINKFNSFRGHKNNYNQRYNNNELQDKITNNSDISFNKSKNKNSIGKKSKKIRKENSKFDNYIKLYNKKTLIKNKENKSNNKFNNIFITNTLYDDNKYKSQINNTNNICFNNKENDKNNSNYYNPSLTINNMNYNLNVYEPKIYYSTINNENSKNNDIIQLYKNKNNISNIYELINKNRKSKKSHIFNKIKNNNKSNIISNKNKKIVSLVNKNFINQINSINNDSKKIFIKKNVNILNNKNFDKIKKLISFNKEKIFENKERSLKTSFEKKIINSFIKIRKKEKSDEKYKNEQSYIKKNEINKDSLRIINKIKKLDFGLDYLYKLRLKKEEDILKNRLLNSEKHRKKFNSPSITIENGNITTSNYEDNNIFFNKTTINDDVNKNIPNKFKRDNDIRHNILNSLINDYVDFTTIRKRENKYKIPIINIRNIKWKEKYIK